MNSQHQQLLGNLAQDYYLSKMAISDISKKYNLSRYLIMKYLDEAFSSGIVDISIHTDYDRNAQLERELSNSFDIKNVYVIKDPSNPLDRDKIIANFAANQIQSLNSTRILLKNGTELPISRRRIKDLQKFFTNHIIERFRD